MPNIIQQNGEDSLNLQLLVVIGSLHLVTMQAGCGCLTQVKLVIGQALLTIEVKAMKSLITAGRTELELDTVVI